MLTKMELLAKAKKPAEDAMVLHPFYRGKVREIVVKGVFAKSPRTPNSDLVREWVNCERQGHILVDVNCATSWSGVFAAGNVTHVSEQVPVHIGKEFKAAISACHHLLMC